MTPMTLTEKIMARAAGRPKVHPGELVWCRIDSMFTHDPCTPGVIGIFEQEFGVDAPVFNAQRYALIPDHFVFTTDAQANRNLDQMADFAQAKGTPHYFGPNSAQYKGVCHLAMTEAGLIQPGWLVVGTDSHTVTGGALGALCLGLGNTDAAFALGTGLVLLKVPESLQVRLSGTLSAGVGAKDVVLALLGQLGTDGATYQAIEWVGEGVAAMEVEDRMTLCNMTVEAGAKAGICASDQKTLDYLAQCGHRAEIGPQPDADAAYLGLIELDLNQLGPQVALPSSPDRVKPVVEVAGQPIDQVYIGSCTGGKLSDFKVAVEILAGRQVVVPTYAVPGSQAVLEGLVRARWGMDSWYEILLEAGVKLSHQPGCAACCGGPKGTFGRVEAPIRVVSTTNRNFPGRMGHKAAQVYLASAQSAAAAALSGTIQDPRSFVYKKNPVYMEIP